MRTNVNKTFYSINSNGYEIGTPIALSLAHPHCWRPQMNTIHQDIPQIRYDIAVAVLALGMIAGLALRFFA
jgi:hypothetical protein